MAAQTPQYQSGFGALALCATLHRSLSRLWPPGTTCDVCPPQGTSFRQRHCQGHFQWVKTTQRQVKICLRSYDRSKCSHVPEAPIASTACTRADLCHAMQVCPYGLYAEQLSGTAFTVPRKCV